jgi:hypothetical protein
MITSALQITYANIELDQEWIDILSHHLVRETQFLDLMKNVPEPTSIFVSKKWLASIHLPRRYILHPSWNVSDAKSSVTCAQVLTFP